MGCDIHLRVEYRAGLETIGVGADGEITVVPAVDETVEWSMEGKTVVLTRDARDVGVPVWQGVEPLQPNPDKDPDAYDLTDPGDKREYDSMPDYVVRYHDRWYRGRNYQLFSRLIPGLRGHKLDALFEERGIPEDASASVLQEIEEWGEDGHSHSWQTLEELEQHDWRKVFQGPEGTDWVDEEWMLLLERMRDLANERCGGDASAVRIVYFFDN